MSQLEITLKIRYTPSKSDAMARAWEENTNGLLYVVRSDLNRMHMSFLGASLANLDWMGGREPAAVLRWIHDGQWVRNASSTRRQGRSRMLLAAAVNSPRGRLEGESQHIYSRAVICVRRQALLRSLELMSLRLLVNLRLAKPALFVRHLHISTSAYDGMAPTRFLLEPPLPRSDSQVQRPAQRITCTRSSLSFSSRRDTLRPSRSRLSSHCPSPHLFQPPRSPRC
jgi:hypothetical protein